MQKPMKRLHSPATTHSPTVDSTSSEPDVPLDADALRALAWLKRGQPASEIVYDDDAPKQTDSELALFRPASYVRKQTKKKP
jgi:hypothetical protein